VPSLGAVSIGCHSFISSPVECAWSACSVSWIHRSQAPRALPRNKEVVSRTSEVLSMRFSLTPALTALAFLAGVHEQAAARGWEFDCKYGRFAQDLEGPRATDFSMRFNFDDITNKAGVVGNNGVSDVSVYRGRDAITFMELLDTGAVLTTTISLKTGGSIHSRHTLMSPDGVLLPSQYLGSCSSH
jgi:hypothetical protein